MEFNKSSFYLKIKKQHTGFWEAPDSSFLGILQFLCLSEVLSRLDGIDNLISSLPLSNNITTTSYLLLCFHLTSMVLQKTNACITVVDLEKFPCYSMWFKDYILDSDVSLKHTTWLWYVTKNNCVLMCYQAA